MGTPLEQRKSLAKEDLPVDTAGRRRRRRPQQSWKNQVTNFMRSRNLEDVAENRHLWRSGMDRRPVYILIIIIIIIIIII